MRCESMNGEQLHSLSSRRKRFKKAGIATCPNRYETKFGPAETAF